MIKYHENLTQGSDEWLAARCGLLTASKMKLILTPTLKIASNDDERKHLYELLAQRVTRYIEPSYVSDDMLRGRDDEPDAIIKYSETYSPVREMGFITNDEWGFTIGYSPDGLVGEDGLVEAKSRRQRFQVETIIKNAMPKEYVLQVQTGLLVSGRKWCDFITYCGGMHMLTLRIYPDSEVQEAIIEAATAFEMRLSDKMDAYNAVMASKWSRLIPTERRIEQEMFL